MNQPDATTSQTARVLSRMEAWRLASRPKTLPAAVGPVLVGTALAAADGRFALLPALAALAGALLLQIAVNLANDYFDHQRGVDTPDRLGPPRAAASGLLSPAQIRVGIAVVLGLTAIIGVYLIAVGGWPVLAIGLASMLAALAYSGGPFPLASNGLGDLFVFIFFGLVAVVGTYYVQALAVTPLALAAAVPVGALITAILVVNNLRDIPTDRRAGKRTLAVILGARGARIEYTLLLLVAFVIPVGIVAAQGGRYLGVLLTLLALPAAIRLARDLRRVEGRALNPLLGRTAQLSLVYSALLSLGLLAAGFIP